MKTITKTTPYVLSYDLELKFPNKKLCFFDIETTGLGRRSSMIYLIGLCVYNGTECETTLYFNDDGLSEHLLLQAFDDYVKDFDIIFNFNGDSFDLPFVKERAAINGLSLSLDTTKSFDLFKFLRPYKTKFNLANLKQKSIELFLGIERDDLYDGGRLIQVYKDYLTERSDDFYDLLILHNYEDIIGMVKLCEIFAYTDVMDGAFSFISYKIQGTDLLFTYQTDYELHPFSVYKEFCDYHIKEHTITLKLAIQQKELKYFYKDYKNYYYLPKEDTAIHKSVAEFVEKEFREKATKQNCYTKKAGDFCLQPTTVFTPAFYESYKDKTSYFSVSDTTFTPDNCKELLLACLCSRH